jgi:uncharacterized protein YkwD
VSERRETLLIDDPAGEPPRRGGRRAARPTLPTDPITIALVVGGVLAVIGVSLAVLAPVVSGHPSADTMPAGVVVTASASAGASPTVSTQASPNAAAKTTGPPDKFKADTLEDQVVRLTNTARNQARCKDVRNASRLHSIARAHSTDMAATATFSSTGSDGTGYNQRATKAGVKNPVGENIARGQTTAQEVVQYWLSRPSTKALLLNCDVTDVGVGVARAADGTYYWTQDFAKS